MIFLSSKMIFQKFKVRFDSPKLKLLQMLDLTALFKKPRFIFRLKNDTCKTNVTKLHTSHERNCKRLYGNKSISIFNWDYATIKRYTTQWKILLIFILSVPVSNYNYYKKYYEKKFVDMDLLVQVSPQENGKLFRNRFQLAVFYRYKDNPCRLL